MPDKIEEATIVEKPVTTIAEYTATAAALATFNEKYKGVIYDVATTAGMKSAIEGRAELRDTRVALEKKRKEIKEPALTRCKQIDSEAARITAEIESLEKPINQQIQDELSRKEREKAEKEAADTLRKANIQELIARIRSIPSLPMPDSASISVCMAQTDSLVIDPQTFMEFTDEAELAKTVALSILNSTLVSAQAREEEQRQIEADRKELEELREKQADMQRQLDEANAAEQARLDAEKEKIEQERIAHEQKMADEQAEIDRIAAEAEAKRKAEQDELDRIRFEEETARLREAEEKQRELDRIAEEERQAKEKKLAEEAAENAKKAAEAEKERKAAEKKLRLAAAKCETATIAFHKILKLCKEMEATCSQTEEIMIICEANL